MAEPRYEGEERMKLRNKKTGEIVEGYVIVAIKSKTDPSITMYDNTAGSVAEFNEKWEDYELVDLSLTECKYE